MKKITHNGSVTLWPVHRWVLEGRAADIYTAVCLSLRSVHPLGASAAPGYHDNQPIMRRWREEARFHLRNPTLA